MDTPLPGNPGDSALISEAFLGAVDGTMSDNFSPAANTLGYSFWGDNLDATTPLWTEQTGPAFPEGAGGTIPDESLAPSQLCLVSRDAVQGCRICAQNSSCFAKSHSLTVAPHASATHA